ncbi:MAG: hypothetical protein PHU12_01720 [Candidatus Aenigmarchaeota archaeon]|nr:hypothetical protein [Candidatus Aenigmarchaeota archaeon]
MEEYRKKCYDVDETSCRCFSNDKVNEMIVRKNKISSGPFWYSIPDDKSVRYSINYSIIDGMICSGGNYTWAELVDLIKHFARKHQLNSTNINTVEKSEKDNRHHSVYQIEENELLELKNMIGVISLF